MIRTETVRTSELQLGDVVHCHGLRCFIDRPLEVSRAHPDSPGVGDGKTRYTSALILNRDEESTRAVPRGWTVQPNGEHRWSIQGNDLALWAVERAPRCGSWKAETHLERGSTDCGCGWGQLCDAPR